MKEKESSQNVPGSLRREIWIHPDSGRRLHRTTSAAKDSSLDSEEEDLQSLSSLEVSCLIIFFCKNKNEGWYE